MGGIWKFLVSNFGEINIWICIFSTEKMNLYD